METNQNAPASFTAGMRVTYETFGVCVIESITKETYYGVEGEFVSLKTGTGNVIKVAMPTALKECKGIGGMPQLQKVLSELKKSQKKRGKWWKKTQKEYSGYLGSGDVTLLAKIVRDIHPGENELTPGVQALYQAGLYQLVMLLQVSDNIADPEIILDAFTKATGRRHLADDLRHTTLIQLKPGMTLSSRHKKRQSLIPNSS